MGETGGTSVHHQKSRHYHNCPLVTPRLEFGTPSRTDERPNEIINLNLLTRFHGANMFRGSSNNISRQELNVNVQSKFISTISNFKN